MSDEKISTKVLCAIFATGILSFCGVAGETAMNITFPVLMKAFSVNTSTVQWVTTIYLLVVACVVPLSAYLKRSFRMKTIFLVANLLSILGVLIDFIAPSFGFVCFGYDWFKGWVLVLPYLSCLTSFWSRCQVVRLVS